MEDIPTDTAAVLDELDYWLQIVRDASRLHDNGPVLIANDIERHGGEHELSRLVYIMAGTSTATRQRLERTLVLAVMLLRQQISRPDDDETGRLRIVSDG